MRYKRTALPNEIGKSGRRANQSRWAKQAVVITVKDAESRFAQASRVRQHGLEHRLQFSGRAGYHTQHLRGRSLLF